MQRDEQKLTRYFVNPPADIALEDIDLERLPKHISFIMDGNGRWATAQGLERGEGHKAGIKSLRETITACVRLGIDCMSAYAFSTENWKRPQEEVDLLMHLFAVTLVKELPLFHRENVKLVFLGDLAALPEKTRVVFQQGLDETADHTGMVLALAVNYGSRAELVHATQEIARKVASGELTLEAIDADLVSNHLYTAGLPDPDLLVRTSGELRLSNYLLWQLAYSEFYITDTLWPDFGRWELLRAIAAFQGRDRRFGGVKVNNE